MVTIQVNGTSGRPVDVQISWRGYTHSTGKTDSNGKVSFDVSDGTGTLYVDGKEVLKDKYFSGTTTVNKP
jgi:hypothetical protein